MPRKRVIFSAFFIPILLFSFLPSKEAKAKNLKGDGKIYFYNTHSRELEDIQYRDRNGTYIPQGIKKINWIMRCHGDGKTYAIDKKLIELIDIIQDHFGKDTIVEIISGYRSPAYNARRRRQSRGVAQYSRHLRGQAIDFRIRGVPLGTLLSYAWNLKQGGVGYYPSSNFIHVDTGRVRIWPSWAQRAASGHKG